MDKAYNILANNPRVLVLDARSLHSYNAGHIRGSICVTLSHDAKTLHKLAGPHFSSKCWWDRDILLLISSSSSSSSAKKRKLEQSHPVAQFLSKEGLVKSLLVLGPVGDDVSTSLSSYARNYPFLVTKSPKAASISGYPTEVLPQLLYLGNMETAKSEAQLAELKISHVLTIHTESISYNKPIVHMFVELSDEPMANIAKYFDPVYNFIRDVEKKEGRVLVHCGAGASRSATLCAAYLMRTKQWGVDDTLKYLKERRSQVNPNSGFISALYEYQKRQLLSSDIATPSQICSGLKEKNDRIGSVDELKLEIQKDGNSIGFIKLMVGRAMIFGRDPNCDVILDHASISRQHAKMETTGDSLILTDLRSVHGTFLNGKLLECGREIVLGDSDGVRFGASTRNYIVRKTRF